MSLSNLIRFNISSLYKFHLNSRVTRGINVNIRNKQHFCNYYPSKPFKFCYTSSNCNYSSDSKKDISDSSNKKVEHVVSDQSTVTNVSQRVKLRQAVRDYGATIVVFHVAISLTSLGICYLAISNGVDAINILTFLGFSESVISSKVAVGGSTFVMAYAVHKLFAPVRIGITLSVAPFIVRYLRKINLLKPPKKLK